MTWTIRAVPNLSDNYAWLLRDEATGTVALCDPGEAAPCLEALGDMPEPGRLDWVLLTHHHPDHIDGVEEVVRATGAKVLGAAADARRLPRLDLSVKPGDHIPLGSGSIEVLDSPGHTLGHIALYIADAHAVLCGDTLFSLGCGRLLEGTPEDMYRALQLLNALPGNTLVLCGHEYTESNARFALTVEPDNAALRARAEEVRTQRKAGQPTVPTTLDGERATNPFLRARDVAQLAERRAGKDVFKG
ncbi:hydroxyacylglutathione hydrolase [Muricoccus pecuniae]|uniref:Hydroxyacylglutathione hydrolase n=1 Tax=Muricoccus pecuniae TaxID=693023 RepID=A0A840YDE7_9PROT|nr:hydroxyacylglutathione hydrolase [Roseomonas pecuniae]MBB5694161.1 hydroxyacylglutathione hydrolase [Roseomonas pecuniae]